MVATLTGAGEDVEPALEEPERPEQDEALEPGAVDGLDADEGDQQQEDDEEQHAAGVSIGEAGCSDEVQAIAAAVGQLATIVGGLQPGVGLVPRLDMGMLGSEQDGARTQRRWPQRRQRQRQRHRSGRALRWQRWRLQYSS
ncbi:hypothetical protein PF008_g26765 [Phytophthora fragariae]|uniref:Uncharacterized protein n=1 Tax=Phytophthora fragariae TaxID=53985 RepID=A0A6G0QGP9_9STRA|nr:hypothetical protein PF008_g26765 [Phytophthora fragariae]